MTPVKNKRYVRIYRIYSNKQFVILKKYLYRKRKRYMGDFQETDLNSPGKRLKY